MIAALQRVLWVVVATAVAVAALIAIVKVLRGDFTDTDGRTILSLVAVFLCGGAAIASLELLERGRLALLGSITLIASASELVLFLIGIWRGQFGDGGGDDAVKLVPTALAWVIATIVIATLPLLTGERRLLATVVLAAGACAAAGATIATAMVWTESDSEAWGKALSVLAILMVAGYLLTPALARLASARSAGGSDDTGRGAPAP